MMAPQPTPTARRARRRASTLGRCIAAAFACAAAAESAARAFATESGFGAAAGAGAVSGVFDEHAASVVTATTAAMRYDVVRMSRLLGW